MSMIFQTEKEAERSCKTISAPKILADVIASVEFKDGIKVEKQET